MLSAAGCIVNLVEREMRMEEVEDDLSKGVGRSLGCRSQRPETQI